ncbi:MAG: tRNA dihydrouridine synthase DusB [Elusimicrobiaceae bacterium]|nr:tRNA dihydrouridine synthase DusB [Elusimicrobiaceae bacterium]
MTPFARPLSVGGVKLSNNLSLAPMAGITDSPFRRVCLRGGAGLVCAEMVSARGVLHENARTQAMLGFPPDEHPVSLQIFGCDAEALVSAARAAQESGADIVDINAGCPVKKIVKAGCGSALMRDERLFAALLAAAVRSVSIPVTIKFRTGLRAGERIGARLARIAEENGASAVTVHARPAAAFHAGPVDLEGLAAVCAAVKIPVIGNGGVRTCAHARAMFGCGCAGVMIGRGAVGNPFIFRSLAAELEGGPVFEPSAAERLAGFCELLELNAARYGERAGLVRARKVAGYWIRGFDGAAAARGAFVRLESMSEAARLFSSCLTGAWPDKQPPPGF